MSAKLQYFRLLGSIDLTLWALPFLLRWHFNQTQGNLIAVHFLCFEITVEWKVMNDKHAAIQGWVYLAVIIYLIIMLFVVYRD